MPGKENAPGRESSANGTAETFLFTSESVGEGHPGNFSLNIFFCLQILPHFHVVDFGFQLNLFTSV